MRHTLPIHHSNIGTRGGMSKRRQTTRSRETREASLREGSVEQAVARKLPCKSCQSSNKLSTVACVCSTALEEHFFAERDAPDTGGGTPQLRDEHIGRDPTGTTSASAPHFTPTDKVNQRRQVTTPTSPNNIFAGSTELCSRESLTILGHAHRFVPLQHDLKVSSQLHM